MEWYERRKEQDKVQSAITRTWSFLENHLLLANTHGAEFISEGHWNKYVPEVAQDQLLALSCEQLINLPLSCTDHLGRYEGRRDEEKDNTWLEMFVQDARRCQLEKMDILSSLPSTESNPEQESDNQSEGVGGEKHQCPDVISEAMSMKKIHEVGIMSEAVTSVFKSCKADIVIDVGSGKGYLSCELARHHAVPVLGLDSSDVNTHGAARRDEKLGKRWKGLSKKNERKKQDQYSSQHSSGATQKSSSPLITMDEKKDSNQADSYINAQSNSTEKVLGRIQNVGTFYTHLSREPHSYSEGPHAQHLQCINGLCANNVHEDGVRTNQASSDYVSQVSQPSQKSINQLTCPAITRSKISEVSLETSSITNAEIDGSVGCHKMYVPVTIFVHPEMNLRQIISDHAEHLCQKRDPFSAELLIAGLHTCGSLAVTAMDLFLQDPGAVGLCCVGCCYQLMEETVTGKDTGEGSHISGVHFPLSTYGKQLNLHLGRNARNLASQSVHRIQASGQLQGGDFYWRALLDVMLRELKLPIPERIMGMRGLNKRCKTFQEYAGAALRKLGHSPDLASEELLRMLQEKHRDTQQKMSAFFQLKLVLAPVIESLILLDRYLFLLEQECVEEAHLVQLFDPVTSPRCYAIMARKRRTNTNN